MAVIQPNADSVHGSRRRNRPAFFRSAQRTGGGRASYRAPSLPNEAGACGLSVGAVSLTGRTNGVRYLTLAAADGQNCSVALMFIMRSTRAEKYRQEAA